MARHSFWIIVDGETPTSFRSREREDLLPTLTQLKRTQPQVALLWFERGRLWPSPTEAREALITRRQSPPPGRGRAWRPGGNHVDPRAKYAISRDDKRARFKARATRDRQDEQQGPPPDRPQEPRPDRPPDPPRPDRPPGPPRPTRPPYSRDRSGPPSSFRPKGPGAGDRPAYRGKPRPAFGRDRPRDDRPRPERPREDRPRRDKPADSGPRGAAPPAADRKLGDRPWRPRKPWAPKGPWRPKKPGGPKR